MASHAKHRAAGSRRARSPRTPVRTARRRLSGVALSGVLTSGLLVSPALCWVSTADPSDLVPVAMYPSVSALRDAPVPLPPPPPPPVRVVDTVAVLGGVGTATSTVGGAVGAVVLDPLGRTLVQTPDAERPIPSASLVKLLVVQQLLARGGPAAWDAGTLGRMERAIRSSDDGAMNALWSTFDGPALVRAAAATFGLTGTAPPADPGQWGEATTTAADVARFLSALALNPAAPDSAALLGWMRAAAPVAADGFDQTFGLLSGSAGAGVAAKQGWMCCVGGRRHVHSAGVLGDGRVVVVLGELPTRVGWRGAAAVLDEVTAVLEAGTR
jgi:hypothetical protein